MCACIRVVGSGSDSRLNRNHKRKKNRKDREGTKHNEVPNLGRREEGGPQRKKKKSGETEENGKSWRAAAKCAVARRPRCVRGRRGKDGANAEAERKGPFKQLRMRHPVPRCAARLPLHFKFKVNAQTTKYYAPLQQQPHASLPARTAANAADVNKGEGEGRILSLTSARSAATRCRFY